MSGGGAPLPRYVLVTPARNEAAHIADTVASVAAQTHLPERWVVVDDASTDGTADAARAAAAHLDWVEVVRVERAGGHDFGAKVRAFDTGDRRARAAPHDLVGNLDADVTVPPDYFARLAAAFASDPRLGVAGGAVLEPKRAGLAPQRNSEGNVAGAAQVFRRACLEAVGGFVPMPLGGEDAAAQIAARAAGWEVRMVEDLEVVHRGRVLAGSRSLVAARYRKGVTNWLLGYDPLFHLAASAWRAGEPPAVVGSLAMAAGYLATAVRRPPRPVAADVVAFLRDEQRRRLRHLAGRRAPARARTT